MWVKEGRTVYVYLPHLPFFLLCLEETVGETNNTSTVFEFEVCKVGGDLFKELYELLKHHGGLEQVFPRITGPDGTELVTCDASQINRTKFCVGLYIFSLDEYYRRVAPITGNVTKDAYTAVEELDRIKQLAIELYNVHGWDREKNSNKMRR